MSSQRPDPALPSLPPPPDAPAGAGAPVLAPAVAADGGPSAAVRAVVRRGWQQARVVDAWDETPVVRTVRLALPDWSAHLPGQHYVVRLTAPDGYRAQRSYSVASPPEQVGSIDLSIERLADGEVSGHLHDAVRVGDELEVRGPLGGWFVWTRDAGALGVAGGSGVVPLVSMLRSRRLRSTAEGSDVPFHLLVSARSTGELLYRDELLADPDVTVVLTRAAPEGWGRPVGRLAVADVAAHLPPAVPASAAQVLYVCGSTPFASAAERLLVQAGADPAAIRVERFGGAVG